MMAALDYGCAAIGLDARPERVTRLQGLGFNAMQGDFMTLQFEVTPDVLSLIDVLAFARQPRRVLRKAPKYCLPAVSCS